MFYLMIFKITQVKGNMWLAWPTSKKYAWKHIFETWMRNIRQIWEHSMILAQPIARKQKEHSLPLSSRCTTEHMHNNTRYELIISEYRNRQWSVQACSQISDISSPEKIYISTSSIYLCKNEKTNNSKRKHIKYKVTSGIFLIVLTHHVYEKPFSQKKIKAHSAYPKFFSQSTTQKA